MPTKLPPEFSTSHFFVILIFDVDCYYHIKIISLIMITVMIKIFILKIIRKTSPWEAGRRLPPWLWHLPRLPCHGASTLHGLKVRSLSVFVSISSFSSQFNKAGWGISFLSLLENHSLWISWNILLYTQYNMPASNIYCGHHHYHQVSLCWAWRFQSCRCRHLAWGAIPRWLLHPRCHKMCS